MMNRCSQTAAALLCALLLAVSWPASLVHAQAVTTSGISGRVTNEAQAAVVGATVVATNTQTGATTRVVTRTNGRYLIQGLQPGSYRIQVSGLGQATQTRTVDLALGNVSDQDFRLNAQALAIEGLVVRGERNAVISPTRTGAASTVSDSTLRRAPTITRDLQDFTRLVPQLAVTNSTTGAVSAGGRNNRYNQLQVDGTASNDLFGLSGSGTPSGQAGAKAITLEAVQELQVVLAPFDVRQNGFTGASVNAVTKSGTNRFQGSISGFNRNEDLAGRFRTFADTLSSPLTTFNNTEIAGSFGGPILRNRAFFFLAGETTNRTQPTNYIAGTDARLGVTQAQAEEVRSRLVALGYDPGGTSGRDIERESLNLFGRLDFNLPRNNRLTIRHNYIDGRREDFGSGTRTYFLSGAGYAQNSNTNSTVAQLNSGFGGGIFNELRVGYNRVRDFREFEGNPFPRVVVRGPGGTQVEGGTDPFSGANTLDQDALEITNDLTIPRGAHTFTIGTNNEFSTFANLFVRNSFGNYQFDSYEQFVAGTPSRFEYTYLREGGDAIPEFRVNRYSLYAQDRWEARENLQLTFGLRYERPTLPDRPGFNRTVDSIYGRSTADIPTHKNIFAPRFGFNWDVTGDGANQLRGGAGVFSGRTPAVWISNAYGNTGLDYVRFTCTTAATSPRFEPNPNAQPRGCRDATGAIVTTAAPNEINLVDPNFRVPQVGRYSLAFDRRLPMGLVGTLEGLYTQTIQDVLYQNLRTQRDSLGRTVEGRTRYQQRPNTPGLGDVIDITNTEEGYAYNLTAQIQRPFRNGREFSLAYTFSRSEDVNAVTSSQAFSNWRFSLTEDDPNNPGLRRSDNDIPHRVLATASQRFTLIRRLPTDVSLVYVGQSGNPYSFRYGSDVNFDGSDGNDLLYVPRDANDVRFLAGTANNQFLTPQQSYQNLNSFIERVDCLRNNRGRIVERNACRAPWSNRVDFRLAQNLSTFNRQSAQLTLDILNFGNLLNNRWGRSQFVNNQAISLLTLASGSGVNNAPDANGRRLYAPFAPREDITTTSNLDSRYQIQLGVRYSF